MTKDSTKEHVDHYNFASELMIQIVCFYVGVATFLFICIIPPLTIILPYALPIVFVMCIITNIGFVYRFSEGTKKEIEEIADNLDDDIGFAE
jgi:hypothetical protein